VVARLVPCSPMLTFSRLRKMRLLLVAMLVVAAVAHKRKQPIVFALERWSPRLLFVVVHLFRTHTGDLSADAGLDEQEAAAFRCVGSCFALFSLGLWLLTCFVAARPAVAWRW
jgi:hypothetical protein